MSWVAPMLFALAAAAGLAGVMAVIWWREARRLYPRLGDDYPHEHGDGEGR